MGVCSLLPTKQHGISMFCGLGNLLRPRFRGRVLLICEHDTVRFTDSLSDVETES
jgi:hypothetical protein